MGKRRFSLALLVGLLLSGSAFAQSSAPKPIVLLFETRLNQPAAAQRTKSDTPIETQRLPASLRAMRSAFLNEGVVEPLIFTIDTPTIARALLDAKVNLAPDTTPTEAEQIRIGAACGAAYIVNVNYTTTTVPAGDPGNPDATQKLPTLEVESIEIKPGKTPAAGKRWQDTIRVTDGMSTAQVNRREGLSDALNTAARTLVLRFLNIPALRGLRLRTPSSELLPRPVPPPTTPEGGEDTPPQERATQAFKRAEDMLKDGHTEEGIRALRRAINLSPRSLAPRITLIHTWEKLNRPDRVEEETQRALTVADPSEPASLRNELILLLGKTRQSSGDLDGARESFEEVLRTDEKNRAVRLALAQILLSKGDTGGAEPHFARLLQDKPDDTEAVFGLARLLVLKGDFEGAQARLAAPGVDATQRTVFANSTFLETAMRIGARLTQNRASFTQGTLDKVTFLTAVQAQSKRAIPLHKFLLAAQPPASAPEATRSIHKHYVLAASLLLQALSYMQTHLEKDNNQAGAQAQVCIEEFFREMNEAATLAGGS